METNKPKFYLPHTGTITISGKTIPKKAACCALILFQNGNETIEFYYIGANAGHQAVKAMTIFAHLMNESCGVKVLYELVRVMTITSDFSGQHEKDATVCKAVFLTKT